MWELLGVGQLSDNPELGEFSVAIFLANALLLSVLGYGGYLWAKWFRAWKQGDSSYLPLCFQPRRREPPVHIPTGVVLVAGFWIAVNLFLQLFSDRKPPSADFIPDLGVLVLNLLVIPLGIIAFLLVLWEFTPGPYRLHHYFHLRGWKEELHAGGEIFLLAMLPTFLFGLLANLWKQPEDMHILLQMLQQGDRNGMLLLVIVLTAVVVAPLLEELLFRVLLLNGLLKQGRLRKGIAVLIVSVIFCLAHGIYDALQLMPLSLCLGWCLVQRQSYLAIFSGHALFNAFMLTLALLFSQAVS